MRLVISEKNIAARRIAEILAVGKPTADKVYSTPVYRFRRDGEEWVSIGLKGHIMKVDFPEEVDDVDLKKWKIESLPTLVKAPILKEGAEKGIIRALENLSKKADHVVIATDFDREGELIGADARDVVRRVNADVPVGRVRFSAITKDEIERAFAEEGALSEELADAGETRQDIDLVWGAVLTRYLTLASNAASKRAWGDILSAGRVQTPTLKLIVDRERERDAFVPEDYWTVRSTFESTQGEEAVTFTASHAKERFAGVAEAERVMAAVEGASTGNVAEVTRSRRTVKPPAPFNTTALQAAAAAEGLSPSRTMRIAESLYMSGLISYPRVDNTVYPPSLELHTLLRELEKVPTYHAYASALLKKGKLTATRGAKETTDHPPIHPTGAADPERLKPEEYKLYNLVARRFMATLSDPALIESTKLGIDVGGERFVARGDVVVSAGFRAVYPYGMKKEEHLPVLAEGEEVGFLGAEMEAKQTQPPARYSQGKLIQEMEKRGLGTKATRHDIIQTLYDRKYTSGDPIQPTRKGISVENALVTHAERITTPEMTAELEREMDEIAKARTQKDAVVGHSRRLLAEVMKALLNHVPEVGELLKAAADEDAKVGTCPESGHDLLIKYSPRTRSYFVGCQGYPDCTVTYPLPKNARYAAVDDMCPECGSHQVKISQFKRPARLMCLNTECPTKKGPEIVVGRCPVDGAELRVRYSQVGSRYIRCVNYDPKEHPVSYPLPQTGEIEATDEVCVACGAPKVIVHTKKGPWKICVDPECPARAESKTRRGTKGGKKATGTSRRSSAAKRTPKKSS
ncbi:MAG: DNA topoisomerase I [Coriobacteriia bacterium]|jgi:DNA topoisomerase-1|nr:DNA topoisomerase I [Coriobacteriia bacterium]